MRNKAKLFSLCSSIFSIFDLFCACEGKWNEIRVDEVFSEQYMRLIAVKNERNFMKLCVQCKVKLFTVLSKWYIYIILPSLCMYLFKMKIEVVQNIPITNFIDLCDYIRIWTVSFYIFIWLKFAQFQQRTWEKYVYVQIQSSYYQLPICQFDI